MAPIEFLAVKGLVSSVTPFLPQNLSDNLLEIEIFRTRAPTSNERIALFGSFDRGLIDAQHGRCLVFLLKQYELRLAFPFTPTFIEVFQHYRITPQMLTPNSIWFMRSLSLSIYVGVLLLPIIFSQSFFNWFDLLVGFIILYLGLDCLFLWTIRIQSRVR